MYYLVLVPIKVFILPYQVTSYVSLDPVASIGTSSPRPEWGKGKLTTLDIDHSVCAHGDLIMEMCFIITENADGGKRAKRQKTKKRYSYLGFNLSKGLTKGSHGPEVFPKAFCLPVRFLFLTYLYCPIIIVEDPQSAVKVKSK